MLAGVMPIPYIEDFTLIDHDRLMLSVCLDVLDQRLETDAVLIKHREQIGVGMEFVFLGFGIHHTLPMIRLISSPVRVLRSRRASATLAIASLSRRTSAL